MLSNVAYKPTVYKTGVEGSCPFSKSTDRGEHRKIEKKFKKSFKMRIRSVTLVPSFRHEDLQLSISFINNNYYY